MHVCGLGVGGGHVHLQGQGAIIESENFTFGRNPREHPIQIVSTLHIMEGNGGPERLDDSSRIANTVKARAETRKQDVG